jgi:phytanoyl-CoA hydroxylase
MLAATNGTDDRWYKTQGPDGSEVFVPYSIDPKSDPYKDLVSGEAIRQYYEEHGYVVVRNVIPAQLCDRARQEFGAEIKAFKGPFYRQTSSGNPEVHTFTSNGYMENGILNVHDIRSDQFPKFKRAALETLTHQNIQTILVAIFGEPGQLVQSMYFEGNPSTWPHQDTYYLDSEHIGSMAAAWVAVEDIRPGAGRFYIYPGSHKIDLKRNGGDFDIAFNHDRYKRLIISVIKNNHLNLHAPALQAGDVLLWNSKTIHGSLRTTQGEYSRSSFTAHYIPSTHRFLQFQSRIKTFRSRQINEMRVNYPKDQDQLRNRVILGMESSFPRAFQTIKKAAIKFVTR